MGLSPSETGSPGSWGWCRISLLVPYQPKTSPRPAIPVSASGTREFVLEGLPIPSLGSRLSPQLSYTRVSVEGIKERPVCWSGWNCKLWLCRGTVTKKWGWVGSETLRVTPGVCRQPGGAWQVRGGDPQVGSPSGTHTGPELPPSPASGSTPPGLIREATAPGHLLSARVTTERKAGTPRMELPHGRLPVLEVTTYSSCSSSGRRRGRDPRGPHGARSSLTALGHVRGMGRGGCAWGKAGREGVPPWTSRCSLRGTWRPRASEVRLLSGGVAEFGSTPPSW